MKDAIMAMLKEDPTSRRDFDNWCKANNLSPLQAIAGALTEWSKAFPVEGGLAKYCAIYANECAKAHKSLTLSDAFEMGYAWRQCLRGQNLEDSRAVGRTLLSNIFDGLPLDLSTFDSFNTADHGIAASKAIIHKGFESL